MEGTTKRLYDFFVESVRLTLKGNKPYYFWVGFLLLLMLFGAEGLFRQFQNGLIVTALRDPVSWGFYIGNFTFLVGIAAAAVMLVIPAYIYDWKPIKEIVIIGELLAISALVMCLGFVIADLGQPLRTWHLIPIIGELHFPTSLLAWDVLVLDGYLLLNVFVAGYLLFTSYLGKEYNEAFIMPFVMLSIPAAVSIHTVTAFLYNGLPARPFWNTALLAPRFLASAFCSGPAILLILLQILQRTTRLEIKDKALWKIAELMAYAMAVNLFFMICEIFKEFYSSTHHLLYMKYLFVGIEGHNAIVFYIWTSIIFSVFALILFLIPATRKNVVTLNLGCLLIYFGVYIEKGVGLIIPGFTPSTLGEIYEYTPTFTEVQIAVGIFSMGFLVFTLLLKVAIPIMLGEMTLQKEASETG